MNWRYLSECIKIWWQVEVVGTIWDIKRRIWNKRLLLWWYRLWIRRNEFNQSLYLDHEAMLVMTDKEREHYDAADITKRRSIAHERDLAG